MNPPLSDLDGHVGGILAADPNTARPGRELGRSREGRPVFGWRFTGTPGGRAEGAESSRGAGGHASGSGAPAAEASPVPTRIGLVAGCHADEPTGPRLLRRLVAYLSHLGPDDPLLHGYEWWIVPHANPDGEARNRRWQATDDEAFDLPSYLTGAVRELPGDDMEFGFPAGADDAGARPENRAIYDWWREATGPFTLHGTLHGMGFAAGPWFLVEPAWVERAGPLMDRMERWVQEMGYILHDVERQGEKGFVRIRRGFATRPDSRAMRDYFLARGDGETAGRFRPSSMEAIRSLGETVGGGRGGGAGPLTLVSENPLFITPGVGEELGPPDPEADRWRARIAGWRQALEEGEDADAVRREAMESGLRPMPIRDQMILQWRFVSEGLRAVLGSPR